MIIFFKPTSPDHPVRAGVSHSKAGFGTINLFSAENIYILLKLNTDQDQVLRTLRITSMDMTLAWVNIIELIRMVGRDEIDLRVKFRLSVRESSNGIQAK